MGHDRDVVTEPREAVREVDDVRFKPAFLVASQHQADVHSIRPRRPVRSRVKNPRPALLATDLDALEFKRFGLDVRTDSCVCGHGETVSRRVDRGHLVLGVDAEGIGERRHGSVELRLDGGLGVGNLVPPFGIREVWEQGVRERVRAEFPQARIHHLAKFGIAELLLAHQFAGVVVRLLRRRPVPVEAVHH